MLTSESPDWTSFFSQIRVGYTNLLFLAGSVKEAVVISPSKCIYRFLGADYATLGLIGLKDAGCRSDAGGDHFIVVCISDNTFGFNKTRGWSAFLMDPVCHAVVVMSRRSSSGVSSVVTPTMDINLNVHCAPCRMTVLWQSGCLQCWLSSSPVLETCIWASLVSFAVTVTMLTIKTSYRRFLKGESSPKAYQWEMMIQAYSIDRLG